MSNCSDISIGSIWTIDALGYVIDNFFVSLSYETSTL